MVVSAASAALPAGIPQREVAGGQHSLERMKGEERERGKTVSGTKENSREYQWNSWTGAAACVCV